MIPGKSSIRRVVGQACSAGMFIVQAMSYAQEPVPSSGAVAAEVDVPVPAGAVVEAPESGRPSVPDTGLTVSVSRQFRVLGSNNRVRRMFASQAEEAAAAYRKLLAADAGKGLPITIQLHAPGAVSPLSPSVIDKLESIDQSFRLVIHVRLDDGATPEAFRASVVRCLLAGDIVHGRTADEIRSGNLVPAWLERGVLAAIDYREDPSRSMVASVVFARGRAFPVEKLLKESPEDLPAAGRAAYDASACGLVLTLLDMENGSTRLRRLMGDFAALEAEPSALIRHHFQEMAQSDKAMEKWWALQVAQMARPGAMDFIDGPESERRLAQALLCEWVPPEDPAGGMRTLTIADVLALPDEHAKDRERLIKNAWLRVRALGPRVHPLFRPVADAHRQLLEDIMGAKTGDVLPRLAALDAERATLAARLDGIDDYLNWWEVTRGEGSAKDLDRYRAAMKARPEQARPEDPIGAYLDEAARLLQKP